ncbi:GGDEF domain-containing protein [Sulfurimonas sp.]|uniref:GGDEF domain-containing protein n=1 Tax=Sulfurimonas sp. TaxID=2022749 RepID=UPI0025D91A14|nr:GGDEF domain-containing protein [Sulfurimonas sp.]
MQDRKNTLKIISNETKNSIDQLSIVTPSMYASIFSKYANNHNTDLDNENELSRDLMVMECTNLTDLQTQASKNAKKLSVSATKAISAIKEKDEQLLNSVLKETEELRREVEKLKESVYKDELTNAQNRKWLHDHFLKEGTLAIVDLNYFKLVNDTFGHVIGDKVLIFIANKLRQTKYSVVRYGGDEFIIMFSRKVSSVKAIATLNSIREEIISKKLKAQNDSFHVSFSFGVCSYNAGQELSHVIEEADKHMYKDKIEIKKRVTGI